ncbi:MAG: hypothetical protein NVSMB38_42590 [Ktedonobacteraceae bacterium]
MTEQHPFKWRHFQADIILLCVRCHAQGVRRMGLRRSRYVGEPRTHLQPQVFLNGDELLLRLKEEK